MKIIPYHPVYQEALPEISLAWLRHYNILEDLDVEMVTHPEWVFDGGGHILLAVSEKTADAVSPAKAGLGVFMLENNGDSGEILKLGVRENARRSGNRRTIYGTADRNCKKRRQAQAHPLFKSSADSRTSHCPICIWNACSRRNACFMACEQPAHGADDDELHRDHDQALYASGHQQRLKG